MAEQNEQNKPRRRRLLRFAAWLAVLLAVLVAAAKWLIIPAVLRWQINEYLPEYWDGRAEIGHIEIGLSDEVVFHDVALLDRRGRAWLRIGELALAVRDWPSSHPVLWHVSVTGPSVTAHYTAGRCEPPIRKIPADLWVEYVDLTGVTVLDASLTAAEDGTETMRWDIPRLTVRREGDWLATLEDSVRRLQVSRFDVSGFVLADDRFEVGRLTGSVKGKEQDGQAALSLKARVAEGGARELTGHLAVRGVDLTELKLPIRGAEEGLLIGICRFRVGGADGGIFGGQGWLFVDGADLRSVPAAAEVLCRAGIGQLDALADSDVEMRFRLNSSLATFDQARFRISVAAVDVEPGGTIDVLTGQLDAYCIVVLFANVRNVLKAIPLVGLVVDLTEQLSRFRLKGRWSNAESLAVTTEPMKGIAEGSKRFLFGAARSANGGGLGGTIGRRLAGIFGNGDANKPATRPGG